uniref:zinc finger protein CONSTANS-LIKE 5-like n=1 Tax=Erigeron canadensis TaxID=72917 RepID=UPI001CB97693|nr:zinc finger protein CONSTANS-LIKE 5-like [Erigeron canadensis]
MVDTGGVRGKCFTAGRNAIAKPCDLCKDAIALLFCRKHSNFLCMSCDSKLHDNTKHEREWLCEVCEQAPASVSCKADMAALCITCDKDIHSVNPLASRHERIPVVPFYDSAESVVNCTTSLASLIDPVSCYGTSELTSYELAEVVKPIDLYTADIPFFDFGFAIPSDVVTTLDTHLHDHSVSDCMVPIEATTTQVVQHKSPYEFNLTKSVSSNSYNKSGSQSHSHSVCTSSIEPGVIPEENSMLEISAQPLIIPVNVGGTNIVPKARQLCAVDREARVLRYREKRKNRKFEKKIRYASRKAYAEKRPRIKGRFVKRSELRMELDVDRWLFNPEANISSYGPGVDQYGVVPSF